LLNRPDAEVLVGGSSQRLIAIFQALPRAMG
jgi:hypothetical protein